jgi:hypothetical protein
VELVKIMKVKLIFRRETKMSVVIVVMRLSDRAAYCIGTGDTTWAVAWS